MSEYVNTGTLMANLLAISHARIAGSENSLVIDLDAVNRMPKSTMGEWLEERYARRIREHELDIDCLGFPLGFSEQGIRDFFFGHNEYPISLYQQGNDGYRERFTATVKEKLEEKIAQLSQGHDFPSARFVHYGLDLISCLDLPFQLDTSLRLAKPQFDFDYTEWEDDGEGEPLNLYVDALCILSQLKTGLTQDFWNEIGKDPRVAVYSAVAKDFTFREQLSRMIKYWDKIREVDRILASAEIFGDYIRMDSSDQGQISNPDRVAEIERIIRKEVSADKREVLTKALEIEMDVLKRSK